VVETNSISTLHAHVREGRLCAVLADSWLQTHSLPDDMALLPLEPERRQPIGIVWPEGEPTSAMARAVVEAAEAFGSTSLA
jgi:DNA-binding transcriptional LysR family regulator